jgi:glyoxylase-like metal-dependent hydrolase (beta-lactamase superfamily II)
MKLHRMVVGALGANCYVLVDEDAGEAAVVDPGGDAEKIIECIEGNEAELVLIVNTHGHVDHVAADAELKEEYPDAALCIGAEDASMLTDPSSNLSASFGQPVSLPEPDRLLEDGDTLAVGQMEMTVLETPGHSPGSISLALQAGGQELLLCGDLLFAGSVGRTDFTGGELQTLKDSVTEKIFSFPDDTRILPGHGPETTVGREKRTNPIVSVETTD